MHRTLIAILMITASAEGHAQAETHKRALAAGYKSAFLCSNLFTAKQSEQEATANDLEGIYPEYQVLVRTMPAVIDRDRHMVSVSYSADLPPRVAAWRPGLGCTQLPIGAGLTAAKLLPRLSFAPPPETRAKRRWPDGDEATIATAPDKLATAVAAAFDSRSYGVGTRTTAVLVIRDGRIVAERYRDGFDLHTPQRTWSAAKSLTATVIGRAEQLGLLKVDAPASIPEWRSPGDPRAKITLAQLMHMNSGLWTAGPGNRTDEVYVGGGSVTQWATAMPLEVRPGSRFLYANNDTLLAARSVRAALGDGQRAIDFPYKELLWRIGMLHTTAETDWQGNYVLSSQVWTTARDLGRLALLYLNDGVWNGERLLPKGWARFVATPGDAQPHSGAGYGALFWLYGPAQQLPAGTLLMNGNRGQYVFVIPGTRTIIVRRGFDPAGGKTFEVERFGRDVLAALE